MKNIIVNYVDVNVKNKKPQKEIIDGMIDEIKPEKCELCGELFAIKTDKNKHKK